MAQTTTQSQSKTRRVYIPGQMRVNMPASTEYPGGRVVVLNQGWTELDESMANHPLLCRLQEQDPDEAKRQDRVREAEEKYSKAISDADAELAKVRAEADKDRRESVQKASVEYADRREKALASGNAFNEPHPDFETQRAMALTAPAGSQAVASPELFRPVTQPEREPALQSEADRMKGQAPHRVATKD